MSAAVAAPTSVPTAAYRRHAGPLPASLRGAAGAEVLLASRAV